MARAASGRDVIEKAKEYLVPERKPCFPNRNFYRFFGE